MNIYFVLGQVPPSDVRESGMQVQYAAPFDVYAIAAQSVLDQFNCLNMVYKSFAFALMGHECVITGTLMVRYGQFLSRKLSKIDENSAQQTDNASEICCFSTHFLAFTLETSLLVVNLYVGPYITG